MHYSRGTHPNSRSGGFKKGHPSFLGCGAPKENKNGESVWFKKGQISLNKGKKASVETRLKQSLAKLGKPKPNRRGPNNPLWKGGVTPVNKALRMSLDYAIWRRKVFVRDNFTCVHCGQRGGRLEADHIKAFAHFPDLRFDVSNGRTLCASCHRKTDTYGRKSLVVGKQQRMVEIARSFSFRLNVGNFESRDFFCSQKAECTPDEVDQVSEQLHEFCKRQVLKSVRSYKAEQKTKAKANREKRLAD